MTSGNKLLSGGSNQGAVTSTTEKRLVNVESTEYVAKLRGLLTINGLKEVSLKEADFNINRLAAKFSPESFNSSRFHPRDLDKVLPGARGTDELGFQDLTFCVFVESSEPAIYFLVCNQGYPFLKIVVVKSLTNTMRRGRVQVFQGWHTGVVYTDLTNVLWASASGHIISELSPFDDFARDVFSLKGLERTWNSYIPEEEYFVIVNNAAVLNPELTAYQVENFYNKTSLAGKQTIIDHPKISSEYYQKYVENYPKWNPSHFWSEVLRSRHVTVDIILKAAGTPAGRTEIGKAVSYASEYDKEKTFYEAISLLKNNPDYKFNYETLINAIRQSGNYSMPGSIWGLVNLYAELNQAIILLDKRPLARLIETLKWVYDKKVTPHWGYSLLKKISSTSEGVTVLGNLLAEKGFVDKTMVPFLNDDWIIQYAEKIFLSKS